MSNIPDFIVKLREKGIKVSSEGERLNIDAPKGMLTPDLKEELKKNKTLIIEFLNSINKETKYESNPIQRIPNKKFIPLTYPQQRIWFLEQLTPGLPVYNIPLAFNIQGKLDVDSLNLSIAKIIERHEILRTRFVINEGIPFQEVFDLSLNIDLIDLTAEQEPKNLEDLKRLLLIEAKQAFDIVKGPLLKISLYKLSHDEYVLFLMFHHMIFDGWSINLFLRELSDYYVTFNKKKTYTPVELPIQYSDYALWQRDETRTQLIQDQMTFWKDALKGELPTLELPTDFTRPAIQKYEGSVELFIVPGIVLKRLSELGIRENASIFMVLLSALFILIFKYSGKNNNCVGTLVANRALPVLEKIIGFFANTIVIKAEVNETLTFKEFLTQIRKICLNAFNYQEVPFEKIVEELKPERDQSRSPIFQLLFSYQENKQKYFVLDEAEINQIQINSGTSRTDLSLWIENNGKELAGTLEYSTDLFKKDTVRRIIKNFLYLLENISFNPDLRVGDISVLNSEERKKILYEWNETGTSYPSDKCVHHLIEDQVLKNRNRIAVEFSGRHLSYEKVNSEANKLANYLRKLGVRNETYIGICADRSLEMIIAILAVLKAGGTYIPMDPSFPPDRLRYMLEDARVSYLITQNNLAEFFQNYKGKILFIDNIPQIIKEEDSNNLASHTSPSNLAYIIYTSGSTGKPKGVMIKHRALVNFLCSMQKKPGITEDDVLLAVTTISFDIAGLEIFAPLISGGKIVLASKVEAADGNLLNRLVDKNNITVMQATPSTWKLMIEAGWEKSPKLKMLCGGEALPRELASELIKRGGALWNMYGPTETTIWSSVNEIKTGDSQILLGSPISNTRFYVVDKYLKPVPIGVPGELLIGGDGLSRGYLYREELTSEKFIPDSIGNEGEKLYRTGDLVKYLPSGELEFLGRFDFQVKIRGYRIELGEIESILNQHNEIKEAIVEAVVDSQKDKRLIAYIIPNSRDILSVQNLREYLRSKLPEYMIPTFFVKLENFPLNPNGKVDRKRLPLPDIYEIKPENQHVEPRDEIEIKLARIWEKSLGINNVGINDNFFELGGHSLLAAKVFAQIEKTMDKNLPLAILFQAPTISQLGNIIKQEAFKTSWDSLVPIRSKGSRSPLFLIHGAEGNILLYKDLAHYLGEDQPVYGFQSKGLNGKENLITQFPEMAANYIKEMKKIQPEGPYLLGGYCMGGAIAYEMAQQLNQDGDEVALIAMLETYNIYEGPGRFPLYIKIYHRFQQLIFQIGNIFLSNSDKRLNYINAKLRLEFSRIKVKLNILISGLKGKFGNRKGLNYSHLFVDKINDKAHAEYIPVKYDGKVTLFKPRRYYAWLDDPMFGWGKYISPGIEIIEMPINPRGILNEPFVKILAAKLSVKIKEAIEQKQEENITEKNFVSDVSETDSGAELGIQRVNPLKIIDWNKIITNLNNYSFFHTREWAEVINQSYGYKPIYFCIYRYGKIAAIIPTMFINSFLTGKRLVSLPFSDSCDPLLSRKEDSQVLENEIIKYCQNKKLRSIEFRSSEIKFPVNCEIFRTDLRHILYLNKTNEELFKSFSENIKRNIKKALKNNIVVEESNNINDMKIFYKMQRETRKKHGLPPQPLTFFLNIYKYIIAKNKGIVLIAKTGDKPVAGAVFFYIGSISIYKYGASLNTHQNHGANHLIMWEAIKKFNGLGYKYLSMGKTETDNEGLRMYKLGYNTVERTLYTTRFDIRKDRYEFFETKTLGIHNKLFKLLPVWILEVIGKTLYKHIG